MIASRKNPYIIGRPVSEADCFFDRENLFRFLSDSLPQAQVILLHGQRRIGKSSILAQIPAQLVAEPYQFVMLSLEGKSQKPLATVLHDLARDISEDLELPIAVPTKAALAEDPDAFADRFLVEAHAYLQTRHGDRELVLLFDEFDTLGNYRPDAAATHLFPYFSEVIARHAFLRIIPVIGRRLDDLPTLLGLFRNAPTFEIGLLSQRDTYNLITQPARGIMFYEEAALAAIWDLTAGHPYFTQVLCFALFSQAREDNWWQITADDVQRVIDRAIELGEGGLAWFWDGLPIPERVFFAAAAEVAEIQHQDAQGLTIKAGDPLMLLEDYGIVLTEYLHKAQQNLLDWQYLRQIKRADAPDSLNRERYQVTIELVRRWLIRRHGIKQEIWQLEDLEPAIKSEYEHGRELRQHRSFESAITAYETVLASNPNYISAIFELGECLLAIEDYSRAIEVFARAYQIDRLRATDGLIRSHLGYAKRLVANEQLIEAEQLLDNAATLDDDAAGIQQLRHMIKAKQSAHTERGKSWGQLINEWRLHLRGGVTKSDEAHQQRSVDSDEAR